jgi:hypothetical protein
MKRADFLLPNDTEQDVIDRDQADPADDGSDEFREAAWRIRNAEITARRTAAPFDAIAYEENWEASVARHKELARLAADPREETHVRTQEDYEEAATPLTLIAKSTAKQPLETYSQQPQPAAIAPPPPEARPKSRRAPRLPKGPQAKAGAPPQAETAAPEAPAASQQKQAEPEPATRAQRLTAAVAELRKEWSSIEIIDECWASGKASFKPLQVGRR